MKSTMTLTDEVTISSVEDLRGVSDALADLITKAENFAIDGKVDQLSVALKAESDEYRCRGKGMHTHTRECEQEKKPARTYAQLVVKVSTDG